jgi:hypothetical protein
MVGERRRNGGSAPRACWGPQPTASATPTLRTWPGLANLALARRHLPSRANLPETPQGCFLGNSVIFGWNGGCGGNRKGPGQFLQVRMRQVNSAGCQRELGGTTT